MNHLPLIISGIFASLLMATQGNAEEWAVKGEMAESCCCQRVCPCVFGDAPSLGHCEGSTLFEIDEGHFGEVRVDDINVVFAYNFGKWVRLYMDEKATPEQRKAVENIMSQDKTFGAFFAGDAKVLSNEGAKVNIKKTDSTIEFSTPDSDVKLEVVTGVNDQPVEIKNLSIPWFLHGYTQYNTLSTKHQRGDVKFEHTGTNGATSHIEAQGTTED